MKKNGFTLIELLSVIIILSLIAIITFPIITNVMDYVNESASKSSAVEYAKSIASYYSIYKYDADLTNDIPSETDHYTATDLVVKGKGPDYVDVALNYGTIESGYMIFGQYRMTFVDGKVTDTTKKTWSYGTVAYYDFDDFQEPTINLAPNVLYQNRTYNVLVSPSCWGGDAGTTIYLSEGGYNNLPYKKSVKTAGGTGGCFLDDNVGLAIANSTTYTVSSYLKTNLPIALSSYAMDINRNVDNLYKNPTYTPTTTTTDWERFVWTYTSGATEAGTYSSRHIIYNDASLPLEVSWSGFQVEAKAYATPFVNGTRTGTVMDMSLYDRHATLTQLQTPRWVSDAKFGEGSYLFDGVNDYILTDSTVPLTGDQTYSAWIKPTNVTGLKGVMSLHNHVLTSNFSLTLNGNKVVVSVGYTDGTRDGTERQSTGTVAINVWTHVAMVYSASDNTIKIYINGALDSTHTLTKTVKYTNEKLVIGQWAMSYQNNYVFAGNIDDVTVFDRALTTPEINALYTTVK